MRTLVIVESPTKAKTISKFLGKNYIVRSSMGHIRDLPKSELGVDVDNDFDPRYITIRGKGGILKTLKEEVKKSDVVLLASDPDREGEAIAWHLREYLGHCNDQCRIEFNEITKDAVQKAVKTPRLIDMDRVDAQQARRVLDRLVGYKISPILWKKVKKGLSAGRVQSVAVRLICDREDEIKTFVPEEYWSLDALLDSAKSTFSAKLAKIGKAKADIPNQETMDQILKDLAGQEYIVESVKGKDKKRNPVPPFTTSSMQQDAVRKLGMTTKKVMQIAQQLYEGIAVGPDGVVGLITYMRTDSVRVAEEAQHDTLAFIKQKYGPDFAPAKPNFYSSKGKIQNAHEAIRPTSVERTPALVKPFLTPQQFKLYKLIWERFVASQMTSAIIKTTTAEIKAGEFLFRAIGSVIGFAGFMQVYMEAKEDNNQEIEGLLPALKEGQVLGLVALDPKQHFTQPPPRYSEALLVKTLEEMGIGRPSTYAPIIDTILARGYVVKEEKQFYPTELGVIVTDILKEYFTDIVNVEFTAGMENDLDLVEEGEKPWKDVIRAFYGNFRGYVEKAESDMSKIVLTPEETGEMCEKCGKPLVYKMGRYGKFIACMGFPECRNTKPIVKETGVTCMACGGNIIQRKSKSGRIFYGCSNYPTCQYVAWDLPLQGEACPDCGAQMTEKKTKGATSVQICPNKNCPAKKGTEKPKTAKKAVTDKKTTKKSTTKKTTAKKTAVKTTTPKATKKTASPKTATKKTVVPKPDKE